MSRNVLDGLLRRLEKLSEKEKERLRKIPYTLFPGTDPTLGSGLEEWEKEALEHLTTAEVAEYTIARLNALRRCDEAR